MTRSGATTFDTSSNATRSSLKTSRRRFLGAAAAGAGLTILPSGFLSGRNAPSNKLNIANIGAAG